MKRYLKDLSMDELQKLIDENSKIEEMVRDRFEEDQMFWIGEYLQIFKKGLKNWSIGFYQRNYLQIGNVIDFILELDNFKNNYGLSEEMDSLLVEALKHYHNQDAENEDFESKLEDYTTALIDMLLDFFNECTDVKNEYLIDTAVMMFEEEQNIYIEDDDFTKAFEQVNYLKTYQ